MRAKMRDNLGTRLTAAGTGENAFEATVPFDLKQDAGGIVDIEFMVQYAALARSREHPELLRYTDNIRILEGLEQAGLMPASRCQPVARGVQGLSRRRPPPGLAKGSRGGHGRSICRRSVTRRSAHMVELGLSPVSQNTELKL
jgi:[glutamine synthetase] adenylyltransferase / [glutamine synthetase]-adenylyl-L-tyrosine phosphorylase